jgi:hypothetical protein
VTRELVQLTDIVLAAMREKVHSPGTTMRLHADQCQGHRATPDGFAAYLSNQRM